MRHSLRRLILAAAFLCLASSHAFAQGSTTSSISGTVVDTGGGVIPGATVVAKNNATGTTTTAVSNTTGTFSIPALEPGTYTLTVSLSGFKTAVLNDVRLTIGTVQSVKATLEVGSLTETVEVKGGVEIVNTQTATVSSTLNADQINKMPMATRNAINAVTFLPGVNTATTNRNSNFNGLPDSFVAITLDGVNNNDNFNKSTEGLFAMVTPRQDAVEAVTVTTAANGADVGGHGAVQVAFATRSGTNRFTGSAYHYFRDPGLNTNYWFNENAGLPKNDIVLNQFGARQGGPIVLPGLYDGRGKAFFFFNYEELRLPNNYTRDRTIVNPTTQSGVFRYNVTSGGQTVTREVNLAALAAQNGIPYAPDPTVAQILNQIRSSSGTTGLVTQNANPNTMNFAWQSPGNQYEKQPVVKIDYNLTSRHRLSGTYYWQIVVRDPDQLNDDDFRFPGALNYSKYTSYRNQGSGALRSTLSSNMVNELKGGGRWGPGYFGDLNSDGPQTFADQGGYALALGNVGNTLTNWYTQTGQSWRSAYSWQIDDTLSWQKGTHSLSMGGSAYFGRVWVRNQTMAPAINFGVLDQDPANALFAEANFPGSSTGQRDNAEALFGLLTGRVTSIGGTLVLDENTNEYVYLGTRNQTGKQDEVLALHAGLLARDADADDQRRVAVGRPDAVPPVERHHVLLDLRGCVRHLGDRRQRPVPVVRAGHVRRQGAAVLPLRQERSGLEHRLEQPGAERRRRVAAERAVRVAAHDPGRSGTGDASRRLLGRLQPRRYGRLHGPVRCQSRQPDQRHAEQRQRQPDSARRAGAAVLSQRDRLGPPPFNTIPAVQCDSSGQNCTPAYPISARPGRADDLNIFSPDIQVAYARTYNISLQRSITRNTAIDIRFVGTRGVSQWTEEEYNEINLIENGFYDEFRLAMANLQTNLAAGRGATFAYTGIAGTSPLPTYLAYFNGSRDANNPAAYPAGTGRTTRSSAAWRTAARTRVARRATSTATRRGAAWRSRRASRRTTSSSIRTWTTSACITATRSAATTRSRSRSGAACHAGSRSTAATSTRSRTGRRSSAVTTAVSARQPPTCGTRSRCNGTGACRSAAAAGSALT